MECEKSGSPGAGAGAPPGRGANSLRMVPCLSHTARVPSTSSARSSSFCVGASATRITGAWWHTDRVARKRVLS
eukprot:4299786-Prymnesium_polylepis.1